MTRFAALTMAFALAVGACSTTPAPEPEVVQQEASPRPTLTSVMLSGVAVRTLADEASAQEIARQTSRRVATTFEADNKGNACFEDPRLVGVIGGELDEAAGRREEFWTYSVCGETYEVPVIVTTQDDAPVAFIIGSARDAR